MGKKKNHRGKKREITIYINSNMGNSNTMGQCLHGLQEKSDFHVTECFSNLSVKCKDRTNTFSDM